VECILYLARATPQLQLNAATVVTQRQPHGDGEVHLQGVAEQFHADNGTLEQQAETQYVSEHTANADP